MIAITICVYIIGLLILYVWGQMSNGWYEYYYVWDKGKDLIFYLCLHLIVDKRYKWAVKPVIVFSLIRFIWQILSSITGWNINNEKVVEWLFILLAFICSFITIKELLKWHR